MTRKSARHIVTGILSVHIKKVGKDEKIEFTNSNRPA
jgi:hypothetical protein